MNIIDLYLGLGGALSALEDVLSAHLVGQAKTGWRRVNPIDLGGRMITGMLPCIALLY